MSVFSAKKITKLKSRCQPSQVIFSTGDSTSKLILAVGRFQFLVATPVSFCPFADWQGQTALSIWKSADIPWHVAPFLFKPEMVSLTFPPSHFWFIFLQSARESYLLLKGSNDTFPKLWLTIQLCHITLLNYRVKSIKFTHRHAHKGPENCVGHTRMLSIHHGRQLQ